MKSLIKSFAAHRRLARFAKKRLRAELRNGHGVDNLAVIRLAKHIDANLRCARMDLERSKEAHS